MSGHVSAGYPWAPPGELTGATTSSPNVKFIAILQHHDDVPAPRRMVVGPGFGQCRPGVRHQEIQTF